MWYLLARRRTSFRLHDLVLLKLSRGGQTRGAAHRTSTLEVPQVAGREVRSGRVVAASTAAAQPTRQLPPQRVGSLGGHQGGCARRWSSCTPRRCLPHARDRVRRGRSLGAPRLPAPRAGRGTGGVDGHTLAAADAADVGHAAGARRQRVRCGRGADGGRRARHRRTRITARARRIAPDRRRKAPPRRCLLRRLLGGLLAAACAEEGRWKRVVVVHNLHKRDGAVAAPPAAAASFGFRAGGGAASVDRPRRSRAAGAGAAAEPPPAQQTQLAQLRHHVECRLHQNQTRGEDNDRHGTAARKASAVGPVGEAQRKGEGKEQEVSHGRMQVLQG
eukprot:Rhum_TRINITY_DN14979_c12_g1::Rhum_TRINITY_DN14979_c12_g1_i1::g.131919::m.131919